MFFYSFDFVAGVVAILDKYSLLFLLKSLLALSSLPPQQPSSSSHRCTATALYVYNMSVDQKTLVVFFFRMLCTLLSSSSMFCRMMIKLLNFSSTVLLLLLLLLQFLLFFLLNIGIRKRYNIQQRIALVGHHLNKQMQKKIITTTTKSVKMCIRIVNDFTDNTYKPELLCIFL